MGAGKTTLINVLTGFQPVGSARSTWEGERSAHRSAQMRRMASRGRFNRDDVPRSAVSTTWR